MITSQGDKQKKVGSGEFEISYTLAVENPSKETLKQLDEAKSGMQSIIMEIAKTMKIGKFQLFIMWVLTRFVSRRIEPYKVTFYFTFL